MRPLVEQALRVLEQAGVFISLFAVAATICSFIASAWRYVRQFKEIDQEQNFNRFKKEPRFGKFAVILGGRPSWVLNVNRHDCDPFSTSRVLHLNA